LILRIRQEIQPKAARFQANTAKVGLGGPLGFVFRVARRLAAILGRRHIPLAGHAGPALRLLLPPLQVFTQGRAQALLPGFVFGVGHAVSDMRANGRKIKAEACDGGWA
jgi:hypothetical protein